MVNWKGIIEAIPDAMAITDLKGNLVFQNASHRERFGVSPFEYLGDGFMDAVLPLVEEGKPFSGVVMVPRQEEVLYLLAHIFLVDGALVFHFRDVGDLVLAERRIHQEHKRYEFLLSSITDVVGMLDDEGRVVYVSPSVEGVKGLSAEEVVGSLYTELVHPQDAEVVEEAIKGLKKGKRRVVVEVRCRVGDESYRYFEVTLTRAFVDGFSGFLFSERDVTDRKLLEYKYQRLIYTDDVTGLPNKRLFEEKLRTALGIAKRNREFVVVMVLDLCNMRRVNEIYGSLVGDMLLREFGARLMSTIRISDVVGRLWGDEFVLALVGMRDIACLECMVKRILEGITGYANVAGERIFLDVNVGVAVFPLDALDPDDLVRCAHMALSTAKEQKKKVGFYSKEIEEAAKKRDMVRNDLIKAIQNREFILHFQPIVSAGDRRVVGAEVLVRWLHPTRGLVYPDDFIPVAEDFGLIESLGDLIYDMAFEQLSRWHSRGINVRLSLNASYREIQGEFFISKLQHRLKDLDRAWVEIEITERVAFEDKDKVLAVMKELKEQGLSLSLDDFGTGYSSLEALVEFPVDRFKIDKDFVVGMLSDEKKAKVVRISLQMARALGVSAVAEGVETEEHVRLLVEWGCDELQGFYFARPMPAEEFEEFYLSRL